MAYTTYAWFFDDESNSNGGNGNTYGWSYCNIDVDLFTQYRPDSHEKPAEDTEKSKTDCTIYEHLSVNYPDCHPNAPGFIS